MIYTPLVNKALRIAYDAHSGAVDHAGIPYIMHPLHLAEQMTDEVCTVAALLHDVVEDTEWTLDELREAGFTPEMLEAVRLLTHDEDVPYMDYVAALKPNPAARAVKLADLRHNSDGTRFAGMKPMPGEQDLEPWRVKYAAALAYLES